MSLLMVRGGRKSPGSVKRGVTLNGVVASTSLGKLRGEYHILVIAADGQVTGDIMTREAIVEASNFPLSIVMVGVGDGPLEYHILVIAADGQVTDEVMTREALVEAANYPMSIVMVGVGDGPWEVLEEFHDGLSDRKFDKFQFVNFHEVMSSNDRNPQTALALHALMEIPGHYKAMREFGLLQQGL